MAPRTEETEAAAAEVDDLMAPTAEEAEASIAEVTPKSEAEMLRVSDILRKERSM